MYKYEKLYLMSDATKRTGNFLLDIEISENTLLKGAQTTTWTNASVYVVVQWKVPSAFQDAIWHCSVAEGK